MHTINIYIRKIQIIIFIFFICYGILHFTELGGLLLDFIIDFITKIKESVTYIGLIEFINNKENSWEILTTSITAFIAIVTLLFLYSRIRKLV